MRNTPVSDEHDLLAARQRRLSRVRGIKNAIIAFIVIWIIASLGFMGFLTYKVLSLESRLASITETYGFLPRQASLENDGTEPGNTETSGADDAMVSNSGQTAESNLAGLEDTIKVYLTFDDGPSGNTDALFDILDDYGIKATFFVQGMDPEKYKDQYRRIVDEGHTLGMHTYSHVYGEVYESLESFSKDVTAIHDLVKDATGVDSHFYRFPGGSSNGFTGGRMGDYISYLNGLGYKYYDWNVSSGDAAYPPPSAETIVENVTKDVVRYKTSIVLMHDSDTNGSTVEALPVLIQKLQQQGAIILPISDDTTVIQHVTLSD